MNSQEIADIERDKYQRLWQADYRPSACARPLARFIEAHSEHWETMLDIGCGDGTTVDLLRAWGLHCDGVDITLAGARRRHKDSQLNLREAPVWGMPFTDESYFRTFSTDVLEHLPPDMVDAAITEIFRVTKGKTVHVISTFPHCVNGNDLHLTVKGIDWWRERFAALNKKQIDCTIMSRGEFLKIWEADPHADV